MATVTGPMAFFSVYATSRVRKVTSDSAMNQPFMTALRTVNGWVGKHVRGSGDAYLARLDLIQRARTDERCRIARELHDRLGEVLTVGLRQLDLYELTGPQEPDGRSLIARVALVEAMRRLRLVTSDLRDDPVTSLEKAVLDYLDRVCADADIQLIVTGDETWASAVVLDEVFLIIREALRNALKHGAPRSLTIGVDLTPYELRAHVHDDGRGFACNGGTDPPPTGSGLAAMRERAALLGGSLTISSAPGRGTNVELSVCLPGHRGDQPR
jgi:signal transduction histidine kinase